MSKLFYSLILLFGQSMAMESIPNPAYALKPKCALTNRIEAILSSQTFQDVENDRQSKEDQDLVWSLLINRAFKVLQRGTALEHHQFFGDVIEQMIRSSKNPVDLNDNRRAASLMHMAVYYRNNSCLQDNPRMLWSCLVDDKNQLDKMKSDTLSSRDILLIGSLYKHVVLPAHLSERKKRFVAKSLHELMKLGKDCQECLLCDKLCFACTCRIQNFLRERVISDCCNDESEADELCDRCFKNLTSLLNYQLRELVLGYHQFGFPLGKSKYIDRSLPNSQVAELEDVSPDTIQLVRWAIYLRSNCKKQVEDIC